jgi:hypothetical protein
MAIRLSTGLRNGTASANSYPKNLYTALTIAFEDGTGTGGTDRITDSANGFVTAGFVAGDYITVAGSTSNNVSGVKVSAATAGYLEIPAGSLSAEVAGDQVIVGAGAGGGSLDEMLRDGVIEVYTGTQPATADLAESGTKLLRITISSGAFTPGSPTNGLNLATAVAGVTSKESGETWSGVGLAAGTAGWFRYYSNAYVTGASTTAKRFDGVCGVGTGELRMSSLSVAVGATTTVDSGTITVPANA